MDAPTSLQFCPPTRTLHFEIWCARMGAWVPLNVMMKILVCSLFVVRNFLLGGVLQRPKLLLEWSPPSMFSSSVGPLACCLRTLPPLLPSLYFNLLPINALPYPTSTQRVLIVSRSPARIRRTRVSSFILRYHTRLERRKNHWPYLCITAA